MREPTDEREGEVSNEKKKRAKSIYKRVSYSNKDPRVENRRLKPIQWPKIMPTHQNKHI